MPPKPTVEDYESAAATPVPSETIKPDLPPAEAAPKPPMTEVNGDTKMSETKAAEAEFMAGALPAQDGPPKPAGTDIVAPVPVKEDSLVKDILKDNAPAGEKPSVEKPLEEKPVEEKAAEQLPERPHAPGPEAAKEPVQDPAKEAFKPEMEANVNGQAEKEKSDKLSAAPSLTEPPAAAPVTEKPSTEAVEEARLDAMPALAAEPPVTGEKRAADQTEPHTGLNGGTADAAAEEKDVQPPAKKLKVDEETKSTEPPATNGGVKKSNSKAKKDKKPPPPVGRTARKTRSQGPV